MSPTTTTLRCAAAIGVAIALGGAAQAASHDRIFSYDAENEAARTLAPGGLTFVFRKQRLGGTRVLKVLSTRDRGTAELKPASDKDLGPGGLGAVIGKAGERDLYEILPEGQGAPLVKAACPNADRGWLSFGALKTNRNLVVHAIGRNLATGKFYRCAALEFAFHGEWKLPPS